MVEEAYYQGYLWWNNKKSPSVFSGKELVKVNLTNGQEYVVEGLLWDEKKHQSYTIRHVDGKHLVIGVKLTKEMEEMSDLGEYLSNKFAGYPKLLFRQLWQEEQDPLCEGMKVLVPGRTIFVGFKNTIK